MSNQKITIYQAYQDMKNIFISNNINTAQLDARLLLQHATNTTREDFILKAEQTIKQNHYDLLQSYIKRRISGEPISRIIGSREFYGLEFKISPNTLDPRPDTETLINTVLKHTKKHTNNYKILDLGTGSGCIILTLLSQLKNSHGTAIDISEKAIETAKDNAKKLKFDKRCQFITANWQNKEIIQNIGIFDIIVSNPPYIPSKNIKSLSKEVRNFDPIKALNGGNDGLDCYRELANIIPTILSTTGFCVFEIGYNQSDGVTSILQNSGFAQLSVEKDLAGHNRCIFATKLQ